MQGLYSGSFMGYRLASQEGRDVALREAIVAVDANVLLNLYRYREQTADDLLAILERLDDRLIVPYQALREFWRHRSRNRGTPRPATNAAVAALMKAEEALTSALTNWAKQVGVGEDELLALSAELRSSIDALGTKLHATVEVTSSDPGGDSILERLESVLEGRVTERLEDDEWNGCIIEAQRRIDLKVPPGFLDAGKEDSDLAEGGAGDYLVWYQATRHAALRDSDLIIVTSDEKDDWWWKRGTEFLGPRAELVHEYFALTGRRLFLMRPAELLSRAAEALQVDVDAQSSADANRVGEGVSEPEHTLWTAAALEALLGRLDIEAPVQANALRMATRENGGIVSRDDVYLLGDYDDDRMLRGFTRPFRRLTLSLQGEGAVPEGVREVFVARYPDGVKASFFAVPPEVAALLSEMHEAAGQSGDELQATSA